MGEVLATFIKRNLDPIGIFTEDGPSITNFLKSNVDPAGLFDMKKGEEEAPPRHRR